MSFLLGCAQGKAKLARKRETAAFAASICARLRLPADTSVGRNAAEVAGFSVPFLRLRSSPSAPFSRICVLTFRRHRTCKTLENFVSLCRKKRGYAHRAHPLFCVIEYQRLTSILYVHMAPPAYTYRKKSKYSRHSWAYSRRSKPPFPRFEVRPRRHKARPKS